MASSIASHIFLDLDDRLSQELEIYIPKPTAIDKTGGILCHVCNTIFGNKKDYDSHYTQHKLKGIIYTCVVCKKQISSYPNFRNHCYLNHVVKNKFQCNHCSKSFCKLSVLNSHISSVHDFKCNSCDDKFVTYKDLEKHKVIHAKVLKGGKDEPPYNCLSCGEVIKTIDMFEAHIDLHCEIHYPCPICKEVLKNRLEATQHLTKHFDENVPSDLTSTPIAFSEDCSIKILGGIVCCHCNLLLPNRVEIDLHFATEHEDKEIVYSCNICSKQYVKYALLGDHCYGHISKDKYQCDQCNRTYPRLSLLVIHTEMYHSDTTAVKPFPCGQCDFSFITGYQLQVHMRIVHEEMFHCTEAGCAEQFKKPKDLILHLKQHKSNLDNWCRQCGLQFVSLSSAERHLDVHRRKHYSCPVCRRQYRDKHPLVKHAPTHFQTVLHVCKMCGKAYTVRRRFMQHLRQHSEARSYRCTHCSKSFAKPHELQQHVNMHTGHKPYSCTVCPKMFANYPNWSKHLNRIHGIDKETIKQLNTERTAALVAEHSKPKVESGIESAGSEFSDFYTFVESDDCSIDIKGGPETWEAKDDSINDIDIEHTIRDPTTGELISMTDTVNAVIDRMDSWDDNLDMVPSEVETNEFNLTDEFNTGNLMTDDSSDITAIVEHIEAMSGEMEAASHAESRANVSELAPIETGVMQYAHMMPVDNSMFNANAAHVSLPVSYYQQPAQLTTAYLPGYSVGFTNQGQGLVCNNFINPANQILTHIDPTLTIKAGDNAKMYVQNLNNHNFQTVTAPICETQSPWQPPLITKVFQYDENNDTNRLFIC